MWANSDEVGDDAVSDVDTNSIIFCEVKSTHEPQVNLFTPANPRENTGVAPHLFPGNREEPTTAMNSCSNLGGNPGLAHIQYPSARDSEDDTNDSVLPLWSNSLVP